MPSLRRVLPLALIAIVSSGCWDEDPKPKPEPEPTPVSVTITVPDSPESSTTTGAPASSTTLPEAASTTARPAPAPTGEASVIKGVVRDEQRDPVAGARITITGYTGKPNGMTGADYIKEAVTNSRGEYRFDVPNGLYGISGQADVGFDGKSYKALYLHPADGNCEKQMSDRGIVKDFVLRLTGFQQCHTSPDPKNAGFYSGGSIMLSPESSTLPGEANLTLTLTPTKPLADGSGGKAVTFTRPYSALRNYAGALETTNTLHDIALGNYRLTGYATLPDGSRQDLRFAPHVGGAASSAVAAYGVSFPAKAMFPYGIGQAEIGIYTAGGDAPAPTPQPTPEPEPTPTTEPGEPQTCYSEHVGPIPCS